MASPDWTVALEEVSSELAALSRSTDEDLGTVKGKLEDFHQRAAGISSLAGSLSGEAADGKAADATGDLRGMLDEMEQYVGRARQEIICSSGTLEEILVLLDKVAEPLSGFKKVNKVLRMLGISTKIESARLGQSAAGFDTLATDVGHLSVQVNDKAAIILRRKDELAAAIQQTLDKVLDCGAQQQAQVERIISKTRLSLEGVSDLTTRSSGSVAELSAISDDVARSFKEVTVSMQAYEALRQQIAEAEEGIRQLLKRLGAGLAGADDTASICEAQTDRLREAACVVDSSVRGIIDSFNEVAAKLSALSTQCGEVAGAAAPSDANLFDVIEKDLFIASQALRESSQVNRELSVAIGAVSETVEEIASFVGDIERIGEEIKLIALNAQIKSAYTGEEGAALGVLAEAIQRLSVDAIDHTGAVSAVLQSIISVTQRLTEGAGEGGGDEADGITTTFGNLQRVVGEGNKTVLASLTAIDAEANQLRAEVEQVSALIAVHHQGAQVLERVVHSLEAVRREAGTATGEGATASGGSIGFAGRLTGAATAAEDGPGGAEAVF